MLRCRPISVSGKCDEKVTGNEWLHKVTTRFFRVINMEINFYYVKEEYIAFLKKAERDIRGFTCVPNTQYRSRNKFLFGACLKVNGITISYLFLTR